MWAGRRIAWLAVINPTEQSYTITLELLREGGASLRRELHVDGRTRRSIEVGALFDLRGDVAFGLEVECPNTCAASLVMWDAAYREPVPSVPVLGCRM